MVSSNSSQVIGMIPARFDSKRFPGKPLALIAGKTLIQRTYESVKRCTTLSSLVVATNDQRIFDHVRSFGGEVCMTSYDCPTGTDRLVDAIQQRGDVSDQAIIINIQGDEPCIEPEVVDAVAKTLMQDTEAVMSTAVVRIKSEEEARNPSIVKCVMDDRQYALYFSRAMIPYNRNGQYGADVIYYHHLGLYAYRKPFLLKYATLPMGMLQQVEDLEQLKVLEHGYKIKVAVVNSKSIGVDTPEDIKRVENIICKQNTSS